MDLLMSFAVASLQQKKGRGKIGVGGRKKGALGTNVFACRAPIFLFHPTGPGCATRCLGMAKAGVPKSGAFS
jgi:hypothetical protein